MQKNLLRKICLVFLPLAMVISSCSGANTKTALKQDLPDISIKEENYEDLDFSGDEDYHEVEIDNPDAFKSTYRDVSPNFTFYLKYSGVRMMESFANNEDILEINELGAKNIGYTATLDNGTNKFTVEPTTPYEPGQTYKVTLKTEIYNFMVERTLDSSVRTIYFNVKEEDKEVVELKDDVMTYPLENVIENTEPLEPHPNLLYKGNISLKEGDVVKFENSNQDDQYKNDTVYAKVVSTKKEGSNTRISYTAPEAKDIFEDLDVHVDDKNLDITRNNFHLNSKEELYKKLVNSDFVQDYVAQTAYLYNFADNNSDVVDFIKSCSISISFKFIDAGIALQVTFLFKHEFKEGSKLNGWLLTLNITGQWEHTYTVSADAQVRKFLGIPYWVDMSVAGDMTNKYSVTAAIALTHSLINPGPDLVDPKDVDVKNVKQNVQALKSKWKEAGLFSSYKDKTESGLTLINIGYVDFYLGYVTFSIELYLTVSASIMVSLGVGWTHETTTTVVSYSTSDGNKTDGGSSPNRITSHILTGEFIGKFTFEVGAKVRLGFSITGLKWLAQIAIDIDGRFYIEVSGFGSLPLDIKGGDYNLDVGFKIEVGFKLSVTLAVVILGKGYGNWNIFSKKFPFFTIGNTTRIEEHLEGDQYIVHLKNKQTKIDDTPTMWFNVLDGLSFSTAPQKLKYAEELVILDSCFIPDAVSAKLVDSFVSNSEYLDIVDGNYIIKDNAPNYFEATATLTVSNIFGGAERGYTINIVYQKEGTKMVDFDGQNAKAYAPGDIVDIPVGAYREGYIFKGWTVTDGDKEVPIDLSQPYKMGQEDIHFHSRYIPDIKFLVEFYDGFNKLVGSEWVTNEEAAHGPEASVRDSKMQGYRFIGWDVDFSCVTKDMKVHGIYARIGEVD